MGAIWTLCKKELHNYFMTPIAYVFIVIFLLMNGVFTFYIGNFFTRGQADLLPFFNAHPWLYMIFVPAVTMRLWTEEKRVGTIELLLTLPITATQAVIGKFLAAWFFIVIALLLTFPIWLSVNYLGNPDNGVILASYVGSILMAGAFIAIGSCVSCLTKNQVVAFILSFLICLLFNVSGFPLVTEYLYDRLPGVLVDAIRNFSFLTNFDMMSKGLIELSSVVYFASFIFAWIYATVVLLEQRR